MMKRFFTAVFALVLIFGLCFSVYAEDIASPDELEPDDTRIKTQFIEWAKENYYLYAYPGKDYNELYHHFCSSDHAQEDWVLIYSDMVYPVPWFECYTMEIGNRVIFGNPGAGDEKYAYPYYLYNTKDDSFCNILFADLGAYDGLIEVFDELKIGLVIGDADVDGELTIMDATYIQRALAGLCALPEDDEDYFLYQLHLYRITDADRDGVTTVLDATRIQRKLAGLD